MVVWVPLESLWSWENSLRVSARDSSSKHPQISMFKQKRVDLVFRTTSITLFQTFEIQKSRKCQIVTDVIRYIMCFPFSNPIFPFQGCQVTSSALPATEAPKSEVKPKAAKESRSQSVGADCCDDSEKNWKKWSTTTLFYMQIKVDDLQLLHGFPCPGNSPNRWSSKTLKDDCRSWSKLFSIENSPFHSGGDWLSCGIAWSNSQRFRKTNP